MRTKQIAAGAAISLVIVVASACSLVRGPSGFWKKYRSDLVVDRFSDQGPWGGLRWIQWRSELEGTFSEDQLREFAESNGWKFLHRKQYDRDAMVDWRYDGDPVFPLNFPGHKPGHTYAGVRDYPRHWDGPCLVLTFDSGWIREDPGTNETSTAFGYVVLSENGRKLAMYHFWGNG
jgi:hypothetical protein